MCLCLVAARPGLGDFKPTTLIYQVFELKAILIEDERYVNVAVVHQSHFLGIIAIGSLRKLSRSPSIPNREWGDVFVQRQYQRHM